MKRFFVNALALALFAGFVSCNDDPDPEAFGDAYVISKVIMNEEIEQPMVVYGLHLDAYPIYGALSSAKAKVGATEYTLEKNNQTGSFHWEQDEYNAVWEGNGNYVFTYTFTDAVITTNTDPVTDDVLLPANITTHSFADDKIELEWDEIDDAEGIYVQLKEADGDVVFHSKTNTSLYLGKDETEYTIQGSAGTWYPAGYTPTAGATYTVEVIALLGAQVGFQAMSVATVPVVWGDSE